MGWILNGLSLGEASRTILFAALRCQILQYAVNPQDNLFDRALRTSRITPSLPTAIAGAVTSWTKELSTAFDQSINVVCKRWRGAKLEVSDRAKYLE